MVKKIGGSHYLATPGETNVLPNGPLTESLMSPDYHHHHHQQQQLQHQHQHQHHHNNHNHHTGSRSANHRGYSTDGEDSRGAPSDRTMSEYMIANERTSTTTPPGRKHRSRRSRSQDGRPSRTHSNASHHSVGTARHYDDASDIYVTAAAYRPPSEISRGSRYSQHSKPASMYSYRSGPPVAPSEISTVKTKVSRRPGVTIETMSTPNPFCPNTKGICCLMLLLNLGLILVTLGFVIVIQFFEPLFVWVLGIIFLIFGFLTLMGSLIYCVYVCRDVKTPKQVAMQEPYWAHHWQKSFGATPDVHYKVDKYPSSDYDRHSDRYSDRHKTRY